MKRRYFVIIVGVILFIGFFILTNVFPKSARDYVAFLVLLLLDLYLWTALQSYLKGKRKVTQWFIGVFYWIPLVAVVSMSISSIFWPLNVVSSPVYVYVSAIILMTYTAKLFSSLFIILSDVIRGVKYMFRFYKTKRKKDLKFAESKKISRSKFLQQLAVITGGAILSTMTIGRLKWAFDFRVRKENIILPNLPKAFNGLRIIQFSDLHLGSWTSVEPIKEIVEIINQQEADLVFFTGDLVNFSTREAFKYESILKGIKSKFGVYSVLGNHDYGDYVNWDSEEEKQDNMTQLYNLFDRMNWKLLRNENVIIKRSKQELAILGVENWGDNPRFPQIGDVKKSMMGAEKIPVKLLLSHDPSHWDSVVSNKYKEIDITFSGHTHGFQFGIETPKFRWSPAQYIYKYWAGLYRKEDQYLYVNRGTGFLGYPGRIGILPEITHVTLNQS